MVIQSIAIVTLLILIFGIGFLFAFFRSTKKQEMSYWPWIAMLLILLASIVSFVGSLFYIEHASGENELNPSIFPRGGIEQFLLYGIAMLAITFPGLLFGAWIGGFFSFVKRPLLFTIVWLALSPALGYLWFFYMLLLGCNSGLACPGWPY